MSLSEKKEKKCREAVRGGAVFAGFRCTDTSKPAVSVAPGQLCSLLFNLKTNYNSFCRPIMSQLAQSALSFDAGPPEQQKLNPKP